MDQFETRAFESIWDESVSIGDGVASKYHELPQTNIGDIFDKWIIDIRLFLTLHSHPVSHTDDLLSNLGNLIQILEQMQQESIELSARGVGFNGRKKHKPVIQTLF